MRGKRWSIAAMVSLTQPWLAGNDGTDGEPRTAYPSWNYAGRHRRPRTLSRQQSKVPEVQEPLLELPDLLSRHPFSKRDAGPLADRSFSRPSVVRSRTLRDAMPPSGACRQSPETGPSLSPGPGQGVELTSDHWCVRTPTSGPCGAGTTADSSGLTGPSLSPGPGHGAVEAASTSIATPGL